MILSKMRNTEYIFVANNRNKQINITCKIKNTLVSRHSTILKTYLRNRNAVVVSIQQVTAPDTE